MAGVFRKQRFGLASETTIEQLKIFSKNPNTVKSTSSWLNVWETWCKQRNIVNKIGENEPTKTRQDGLQSKNRIGNEESENQTYILLEDHARKDDRT